MMESFSRILQRLLITTCEYSSRNHFGGTNPFKIQVNFDIPTFEGQIYANGLEKLLNLLEGYLFVHNFSNRENIVFSLLKVVPYVQHWMEIYFEQKSIEESRIFGAKATWNYFLDAIKEQYYLVGNYNDKYMRWTTICEERDQTILEFTDTFHILHTMLSIIDFEQHMVLKYYGVLSRTSKNWRFWTSRRWEVLIDMFSKSRKKLSRGIRGSLDLRMHHNRS